MSDKRNVMKRHGRAKTMEWIVGHKSEIAVSTIAEIQEAIQADTGIIASSETVRNYCRDLEYPFAANRRTSPPITTGRVSKRNALCFARILTAIIDNYSVYRHVSKKDYRTLQAIRLSLAEDDPQVDRRISDHYKDDDDEEEGTVHV